MCLLSNLGTPEVICNIYKIGEFKKDPTCVQLTMTTLKTIIFITSLAKEVMFSVALVCLLVCLSFCLFVCLLATLFKKF